MPSMKGACGGLGVVLGKWGSFLGGVLGLVGPVGCPW